MSHNKAYASVNRRRRLYKRHATAQRNLDLFTAGLPVPAWYKLPTFAKTPNTGAKV